MQYLVAITGHLKNPIDIFVKNDLNRKINEVTNRFIFDAETIESLFFQVGQKMSSINTQGGMYGRRDPFDINANHDPDLNTRIFVPVTNMLFIDFESKMVQPSPTQIVDDEPKAIVQ